MSDTQSGSVAAASKAQVIQHGIFVTVGLLATAWLTHERVVEPKWFIGVLLVMGGWVPMALLAQVITSTQRGMLAALMVSPSAQTGAATESAQTGANVVPSAAETGPTMPPALSIIALGAFGAVLRGFAQSRGLTLAMLSLLAVMSTGCAGSQAFTAGSTEITVANALIDTANVAGDAIVRSECRSEMEAIGRIGEWDGTHCVAQREARAGTMPTEEQRVAFARAGTAATEAERTALYALRARWQRVRSAYDAVRAAVVTAQAAIAAGQGDIPRAISILSEGIGSLREAASAVGLTLPGGSRP